MHLTRNSQRSRVLYVLHADPVASKRARSTNLSSSWTPTTVITTRTSTIQAYIAQSGPHFSWSARVEPRSAHGLGCGWLAVDEVLVAVVALEELVVIRYNKATELSPTNGYGG